MTAATATAKTAHRCQSSNKSIEHSEDLAYFTVTAVRKGKVTRRVECLSHAVRSQERGFPCELIDER